MKKTIRFLIPGLACLALVSAFAQDISKVGASPSVQSECLANPDGVAIRLLPDGGFMVFSQATGTYDDGDDPDDILDAQKEATAKAKANLAKFMKESISSDSGMESASKKVKQIASTNGNETSSIDSARVKKSFEKMRSHADALLRGVVVLSSAKVPGKGSAGVVRMQLGVSSKTLEALGRMEGGMTGKPSVAPAAPVATPSGSAAAPAEKPGQAADVKEEGSGVTVGGWIHCEGNGEDRAAAVQAALVEGVSMVYGTRLQADSRLKERMESMKAKASVNGEVQGKVSAKVKHKEFQNSLLMQTKGFVDEYRIISVEKVDAKILHAKVNAHFYNPRLGGAVGMFISRPIMKIEDRTRVFDIGPDKRLSGADIIAAVGDTIVDTVAANSKMVIYSDNDLVRSGDKLKANIMDDLTPGDELVAAGKQLFADYLFSARIEDLKYTRKMGMDKATGKFKQMQLFKMKLVIRLTNVRTGAPVCTKPLTIALQDEEIVKLQEESDDADLLAAALAKVAKAVQEWAEQQLVPLTNVK